MASSQTFDDLKKELSEQWKQHTNNLFPVYTTVTQPALDKLLEKLPKKFDKKNEDYAQNSFYKKKSPKQTNLNIGSNYKALTLGEIRQCQGPGNSKISSGALESEDRQGELKLTKRIL